MSANVGRNRMRSKLGLSARIHGAHPIGARQQTAMGKIVIPLLLAMTIAPWLQAIPAQAQAMRTYVSGLGKDNNPCTVAAPCRTLQAALANTLAGGEITTLNSANYGYVTINQAVSISSGIMFQNSAASTGVLNDVQLVNNGNGIVALGTSSTGPATVTVQNSMVANNGTVGILSNGFSAIRVANSTIANSGSTVTGNGTGWLVANGGQLYSTSKNSIFGNTSGNTAPQTAPAPAPPPPPIAKNIVTDFGATCDGVANDATAFAAFNSWALTWQASNTGLIELDVSGTCMFNSVGSGTWLAKGIKKLLVVGYGATLSDNNGTGNGFFLGGSGVFQDNVHSARVATVAAGSRTVTLLNPSDAAKFTVGSWALITGFDLMGWGFPPNPHFFEYVQIKGISGSAITFQVPLKNTYKSTWPLYFAGNAFQADQGGPATLYALDPSWDTEVEYRGLTISQAGQTYANGRSVTYTDVTFTGTACGVPTQNLLWQATNVNMSNCGMEVDKLIDTLTFIGGTIRAIFFQSSSTNLFMMNGTNVSSTINGTPKKSVIANSTIAELHPGAYTYGRSDEVDCSASVINAVSPFGVIEQGVNATYTMSGGVIMVPNPHGPVAWAVPGTNMVWRGQYANEGVPFTVVDVTQNATNTYVQTSLSGGFPPVPQYQGTRLDVYAHPAPKLTFTNCTGSADAVDLSQAPAGAPIYSYSKRTYTGNVATAPSFNIWGKLVSVKMYVTKTYTGVQSQLSLEAMEKFGVNTIRTDGSVLFYDPFINLKIAGERDVFATSVTGAQVGDSGLAVPEAVWFSGGAAPYLATNISGESPAVWPTITIEIVTDQGVVNP
jgi:hypothetical protein